MTNIIFWAAMSITHAVNTQVWKTEPTNFWYKLSWFLLGWSVLSTVYSIYDYVQG